MKNHLTSLLLTVICAAGSLKAQAVTSQVSLPLHTIVSVRSGAFLDKVALSGSVDLTGERSPLDACRIQRADTPCRIVATLVDVSGISELTGIVYHATGSSTFSIPPTPIARGGLTFPGSYQLTGDPLGAWLGLRQSLRVTLPISLGLNSNGQMTSASVPSGGVLWLGNNSSSSPEMTTASNNAGSMLGTVSAPASGMAFDGTNLWFIEAFGNLTKRTPDGNTVLASFPGAAVANNADMAWDEKRGRLWRTESSPPALERINPETGAIDATFPLPLGRSGDPTYPRAAVGVAYDAATDRLYVSFCKVGCSALNSVVAAFDAGTGASLGDLFSTSAYLIGGLALDPVGGNLWAGLWNGFNPVIANMTLAGVVNSSFSKGGPFVDGLEVVGTAATQ